MAGTQPQQTPQTATPTAQANTAPQQPTPPSRAGTQGEIASGADGTTWQWVDGALGAGGVLGVGGGSWVQVATAPSTTTGATNPAGMPSGAVTSTPPAQASGGDSGGGTTNAAASYPDVPNLGDDAATLKWLNDHVAAMDTRIADLSNAQDQAAADYAAAQATGDPLAVADAFKGMQAAQKAVDSARAAQDKYLTQSKAVQDRQQRAADAAAARQMTPAQQEEHAARMQAFQAQQNALQAQIDQNNAARALDQQRLQVEADKAANDNSPAALARAAAFQQAQTAEATARTNLATAQSAAQDLQNQITAKYGQAKAAADIGYTQSQTDVNAAQVGASNAARAVSEEELRQKTAGDLATIRQQLGAAVKQWVDTKGASGISPEDATALWQQKAYGGSQYDRAQQTNAAANTLLGNLMQANMLAPTGMRSIDDQGLIKQALGQIGYAYQAPNLNPQPLMPWAKSAGLDLSGRLGLPADAGSFTASGDLPTIPAVTHAANTLATAVANPVAQPTAMTAAQPAQTAPVSITPQQARAVVGAMQSGPFGGIPILGGVLNGASNIAQAAQAATAQQPAQPVSYSGLPAAGVGR